jgi:hypothetical protein
MRTRTGVGARDAGTVRDVAIGWVLSAVVGENGVAI